MVNRKQSAFRIVILLAISFSISAAETHGQETDLDASRLFTLKVLPLLKEKCFGCHGSDPNDLRGDYDLLSLEGMLKGGESEEPSIVPGNPEESSLYQAVIWEGLEMPPKETDRLSDEETAYIKQWIEAGAPWPAEEKQLEIRQAEWSVKKNEDGVILDTSGGTSDDWTYRRYQEDEIWAFTPLEKPALPTSRRIESELLNPVDAFIGARLEEAGFEPANRADAYTLIRRASYDLIGLPPTPAEITQFKAAYKKNPAQAWDALVDRLLASDHYGERWGQHWLDVARYADTAGFSNDYERSNAWRYRDYVIRAFNADKPYNEFIVEQIAGDELADRSMRKRVKNEKEFKQARIKGDYTEAEAELLVASGFLRMGPWDPAMVKAPEAAQLYIDDVVNAVGQTFLSTTMRCFKCHDHKFDPLPTRDYYRMYAVFAGTQQAERAAPHLPFESKERFEEDQAMVNRLLGFAKEKLKDLRTKSNAAADAWYVENGIEKPTTKDKKELAKIPDDQKPPRHVGLDEQEKGRLKVRQQDEWIWNRRLERYQPMVQSVYNGPASNYPNGRKMRISDKPNKKWSPECNILAGGSLEAPGDKVTPGVLSVLGVSTLSATDSDPYRLTDDLEGRRLGLAQWIADDKNPLTARSIVNRVWQYHFGKPLAGNPNNFGVSGKKPTHPELLDWLAADLIENGWKLKRLHRMIMSSQTYQSSGQHPNLDELEKQDANNDLFARFPNRRLTAEEIRDSMLRVSGELNTAGGGLPIMPEMNLEVALQPRMIQFSLSPAYQPSRKPADRNRRSIYAYRVRGLADPFLETFNQPNPNDSCEERDAASVSPQAFTLLNSDVVTDRSIAFALRVEKEAKTSANQVRRAVELAFGRLPTDSELEALTNYVEEMKAYHAKTPVERKEYPTKITRSLVEEFSGAPFTYEEILPVFEDYVADKKPADVSPDTRALADLCLALFNSNEFMFVY